MLKLRNGFVALVLAAALGGATAAPAAARPDGDAYVEEGAAVQAEISGGDGGGSGSGSSGGGGGLPFTGADLALVSGTAALFLALGVGMRRLARGPESG